MVHALVTPLRLLGVGLSVAPGRSTMSPLRRALASVAAVGVGLAATITAGTTASAGPPPTPAEEFYAEPCIGDTFDDPTQAMDLEDGRGIPVPDLTRVWGPRLDDYNAGKPVVLYDTFGSNDIDGFPRSAWSGTSTAWARCPSRPSARTSGTTPARAPTPRATCSTTTACRSAASSRGPATTR